MELRHLRYFVAVAAAENVTRAARKLHVSQPAVSRQIRDLEEEIGFPLLERGAKSVRLTDAGRTFLDEARAVLERAAAAVARARAVAARERAEIHVGYAPSPTVQILPPTLRAFAAKSPAVRVVLHDLSTGEMLSQLRDGKLHLAFLVRPARMMSRGLAFEELARDPMCVAVAPGHAFARRRTVTLAEVAREPLIAYRQADYPDYHAKLAAMFAGHGKPRIAEEHDSVTSLIAAIEAGCGAAVVTQSLGCLAGPRLKLVSLVPTPAPLVVGVAWMEKGLVGAAGTFLQCARDTAAKPD